MQHRRPESTPEHPAFGELVAQWRLQLRTEVKKASALPTAMFDVCDPMVETRLVETAESMLACLQQPAPRLQDEPDGEQRIEHVVPAELRRLPFLAQHGDIGQLSPDDGLQAEYFAVLVDNSMQGDDATRATAARLLARDFAPGSLDELDATAAELWACTQAAAAGDPQADARLTALCRRIAADALRAPTGGPSPGAAT